MSGIDGLVKLKPAEDERIRNGHVWVYNNEIAKTEGDPSDGSVVWVEDHGGRKLGAGFYAGQSVIAVRLLTRGLKSCFNADEASTRLAGAFARRRPLDFDCVRLVNAEGDYLPGLVVDRYGDAVVVQPRIIAWERPEWEGAVIRKIAADLKPVSVFVKKASGTTRAGLAPAEGTQVGEGDADARVVVREGGLEIEVDIVGGHKTGFYIDQRENRKSLLPFVSGKRVLDCFCYSGVWSCMCAAAGAEEVTGVDSSETAVGLARANAERNGLAGKADFTAADVFDFLPEAAKEKKKYDIIMLDPPSLARTRKQVAGAMRGYIHINKVAMGLLRPGGILVTCSCSHHMTRERFMEMLRHTSTLVRKQVSVMRTGGQPEDHPSLLGVPETDYLKCVTLRVE
jgi:23S rRNA (cytosine1962-C5)-methyltransferase